jgi:hypothetical protein
VIPGTTPAAADDDGTVDPVLRPALARGSSREVSVALLRARLLVPVIAVGTDGEAAMTVPALVDPEGRRALPVFSSYDALRAWRDNARPVPMIGARVVASAVDEGYDGLVLDVAGPVSHTVTGEDLQTLGRAAQALLANPAARVGLAP